MSYKNWYISFTEILAASNSKRQVRVRYNWNISLNKPGSVGSTKPLTLIAKWSYSNSPLETPLRNLEANPLLYFKYRQAYLNTSASNRTYKKTKKKEKNRKKQNKRNKMK